MNIVAPISRLEEIEPLAQAGADELYCGMVPQQWVGKFRVASANRRPGGNLASYEDLAAAIERSHRHGSTLSLVLNAQQYTRDQEDAALEIGERFLAMGGDALIVSDPGLIDQLSTRHPDARIHVSSVATFRNPEAVRFSRELGATRVILPRDVTIAEACEMARSVPEIEIEAFILNDGCVFEEGACQTVHLPGRLGGPICLDSYTYDYRHRNGRRPDARTRKKIEENDAAYRKWLWYRFSCGFTTTPEGLPFGPCGLCAIPHLLTGGVRAIKIAGREGPLVRKLGSVKMVRTILDAAEAGTSPTEIMHQAQNLRPSVEHCRTGYMCYYPEVLREAR